MMTAIPESQLRGIMQDSEAIKAAIHKNGRDMVDCGK